MPPASHDSLTSFWFSMDIQIATKHHMSY